MALQTIKIGDFRCIEEATVALDGHSALIVGANGAGKTSLLEAVYCLSRGRSFRAGRIERLVRSGARRFTLFAEHTVSEHTHKLGLAAGRGIREIRIDQQPAATLAELAHVLSVEVIDPEVHGLIAEGPDVRRRFLDYGVFHVEPTFVDYWRRYRRALSQRNQALRQRLSWDSIEPWTEQLIEAATVVSSMRRDQLQRLQSCLASIGPKLLPDVNIKLSYRQGWEANSSLRDALEEGRASDFELGQTHRGPHRADLVIEYDGARARQRVSRGQQKLIAAALVLAQVEVLANHKQQRPVLLVDDPAAELDSDSLGRLMDCIEPLDCQIIATALRIEPRLGELSDRVFHVERGVFSPA